MAISSATELKILVKTAGEQNLNRLARQLEGVGKNTASADFKFDKFSRSLKRQEQQATRNISNLRSFAGAWRELANSVDYTSVQFREANREAQRLEKQLAKTTQSGGGIGRFAKGVGAVGAAGIFGGPEGFIGAGLGLALGGPAGAVAGGVAGAQVGALREQAAAIAENIADINRYRIALAGVSKDQKDFSTSIDDTTSLSKAFLLPIRDATEQYTKLKASVVGAGYSTKETTEVFKGIASAIIGTGGSTEDLNSALRATAQVFSKGKVSAEELRQQIGERLPGAFTIFAESMGISTQELDNRLEDGKVTLSDFLTFSEELFERYGETAQTIANSPEKAGARLKLALDFATLEFGGFFQKVGAGFQDYARSLVEFALNNEKTIKQVVTILAVGFNEIFGLVTKFAKAIGNVFNSLFTTIFGNLKTVLNRVEEAINRAKAVEALTPEKVGALRSQATKETEAKYGLLGTGLIIDQQAATDFYNKRFNQLIDAATKAAGATNYTSKIQDLIFPEFTYTGPFGAGIGTGAVIGEGGGAADGESGALSKIKTTSKELLDLSNQRVQAKQTQQELLVAELDYQMKLQKITEQFNAEEIDFNTAKKLDNEAIEKLQERILKLRTSEKNELKELSKGQEELNKQLTDMEILGKNLLNTFAQGMGDAFMNLIDRASSFRDILSDLLRQTARLLLNFGFQSIFKDLFPNLFATGGIMTSNGPVPLKKYASGGVANSPQLAMFGEGSTPEAYVPLPDGRSIPVKIKGSAGGGDVIVNVDAKGSSVEGDKKQSKLLGAAIGAAVQAELIKQKKPGGLLY